MNESHERYRQYLESLTVVSLGRLEEHVAEGVRFRDPFNDVTGADGMRRVFRHMFATVGPVAFNVTRVASDGDACLMSWRFEATLRGRPWSFDGTSLLRFGPDGRVIEHVDYWDAAGAFYEKLPVIGGLLRWLRGRLAVR